MLLVREAPIDNVRKAAQIADPFASAVAPFDGRVDVALAATATHGGA